MHPIEISIELEQHSRLAHDGPRKAYWCLHCDEVFTDVAEFMSHGCPIGPVKP